MGSSTAMLPTVALLFESVGSCKETGSEVRALGFRLRPDRSTCAASIFSPTSFESFTKNDRRGVHDHEERQEHDDRARRFLDEPTLGAVRPEEYLHGQRGGRIRDAFRNADDERDHADQ